VSPSSPIDHNHLLDHLADLALWEAELALDPAAAESAPDSVAVESALSSGFVRCRTGVAGEDVGTLSW
jgi:hypothetical protein